ncbi:Phosphatidylinositol N-acetylglucosaminyltransferase [Bertholletia excelsa]
MEVTATILSYGSRVQGWFFIMLGSICFLGFLYAAILPRFLMIRENHVGIAIQSARCYYCYLVPLTLPILVVAVYFHWLSMKLFKHA